MRFATHIELILQQTHPHPAVQLLARSHIYRRPGSVLATSVQHVPMSCPFAKFATKLPFVPVEGHGVAHYHQHRKTDPLSAMSLSDALRLGTARSHRLVEKSKGVAMILQSNSSNALGSAEFPGLHFDRTDYVQWNVMLASIYTALEAALYASRSHPLLRPLFEDGDLMMLLARTQPLKRDIQAHLAVLHEHTGATLSDLAQHARELHQQSTSTDAAHDVESPEARKKLQGIVRQCSTLLAQQAAKDTDLTTLDPVDLTKDHFELLTPAQTRATLFYVERIIKLAPLSASSDAAGLLLSHAYTRYLGDLSGGQHIHRKVAKKFPMSNTPANHLGFEFYHFGSGLPGVDPCEELKRRFRLAIESGYIAYAKGSGASQALVDEANLAFDLNTALFESLLPAELRMSNDELIASSSQPLPTITPTIALKSRPSSVLPFSGTLLAAIIVAAMLYLSSSSAPHYTHLFI